MNGDSFFREFEWWIVLHDLNKKQLKLQCESKAFGFWREDLRRQLQVEFYQGQAAFI